MNLADSRIDCLRGCLATLSVLVVRISLLEYSKIHEKAYKCIVCEFGLEAFKMYYVMRASAPSSPDRNPGDIPSPHPLIIRACAHWEKYGWLARLLQRRVACCLLSPTFISSSAEYLVSLFNYQRSLRNHKHEVRPYTLS